MLSTFGMIKTKGLQRAKVYCPKFCKLVENYFAKYIAFKAFKTKQHHPSLNITAKSDTVPLELIFVTITKFINYLFAANYRPVLEGYNRERVSTTNFTLCKNISEKIIAKFGVPKTIISDNRIIFRFHNFESFIT